MAPSISVMEYFQGKSVFITGATGFMGKVLLEKLLRSCPGIDKIYILMRPKKGQSSKERVEDFANCKLFSRLQEEYPRSFDKIRLVQGDILKDELGICNADRKEIEDQCHVVFHCAACVRFDQKLRDAVNMNTGGTQKMLNLAENMKKLEAFIHVSTAYCRCELNSLEEELYPAKHKPQRVMETVKWMDDELLDHLEPKIIEPQPNTYAYTKSLTEELVSNYEGKFPIGIARPSIVTATYKEPFPGWVDNLHGPTGLLVGAGKGAIRTMHCNGAYKADVIPVDIVVNGCILLAYTVGIDKPKEIRVCNITESGLNPLTWGGAIEMGRYHVSEFPYSVCLWYPGGSCKSSWLHHQVALFLTHILPAYFIDLLMFLLGKKTFMVKMQKRISSGLEILQYYTTKEWDFKNDKFTALRQRLNKDEDATFFTDIKVIDWNLYIRDYIKGAREYCCKEDPATLPQARRLNRQLYYADKIMKIIFALVAIYFVFSYMTILISAL